MSLAAMMGKPGKENIPLKDDDLKRLLAKEEGGSGSGYFGHAGRPGEVGGSAPSGEIPSDAKDFGNLESDFGAMTGPGSAQDVAMRFGMALNSDDTNDMLKQDEFFDVVTDYMDNGYKLVNEYYHNNMQVPRGTNTKYINGMVDTLDTLMVNETTEDVVVYRSMKPKDLEVGDVFEDKAYVSTSLDRRIAASFGHGFMARIYVPKGTYGVFLGNVYSSGRQEWELLLARQTRFRVLKIDKGTGQIELEVISE